MNAIAPSPTRGFGYISQCVETLKLEKNQPINQLRVEEFDYVAENVRALAQAASQPGNDLRPRANELRAMIRDLKGVAAAMYVEPKGRMALEAAAILMGMPV